MNTELFFALGLPRDAEISSCNGRVLSIVPPQPQLITAIVAAGVSGEFDGPDPLRAIRDRLLSLTDWTQMPDSPLTAEQRAAWAAYRQALRDLPETYSGEGPIPWPVAP